MHFSKSITAVALAAASFTRANAGLTAPEVVANINIVTDLSQNLQALANSINLLSGPLFLTGQGPFAQIVAGFNEIISTVTDDINAMQGLQPFSVKSDEDAILAAFTDFVVVHQELLNILIGKAGILNDLPLVGSPVATVLRSLESVVDTIAFALIDAVPDDAQPFTVQKNSLDVTIGLAITAYTPAV